MTANAMSPRKLISIFTPCFNEEDNVKNLFARVSATMAPFLERYDVEYVFTDNSSTDRTFELLKELGAAHKNLRAIRFSRNIGASRAAFLGLKHARGDAVVLIQADLQDPPELIAEFIKGWEEGNDVVYGIIKSRDEGIIMRILRRAYYKLVATLSDVAIPENAGDFRLASRRVMDALMRFNEDEPYLRGAVAFIGFPQRAIPYARQARAGGKSSIGLLGLVGYAINGLLSSTVAPIRAVILAGLSLSFVGFAWTAWIIIAKLINPGIPPHGIPTLGALVTFFAGAQMFSIGVIGEYIRKIYAQSLRRPLGFVRDVVNIEPEEICR